MNLKKIIKEEINDLQWIKDVDFNVPFESAKYGTIYKAKIINERLSDDISENCGLSYFDIDKDYFVWVERELRNVESLDPISRIFEFFFKLNIFFNFKNFLFK